MNRLRMLNVLLWAGQLVSAGVTAQTGDAAAAFCEGIRDEGYRFFGCPVKYNVDGPRP